MSVVRLAVWGRTRSRSGTSTCDSSHCSKIPQHKKEGGSIQDLIRLYNVMKEAFTELRTTQNSLSFEENEDIRSENELNYLIFIGLHFIFMNRNLETNSESVPHLPKKSFEELEITLIENYSCLRNIPYYSEFEIQFTSNYLLGSLMYDRSQIHHIEHDVEFLTQRNLKWLPNIENLHEVLDNPLFGVGFGHLIGRQGLLVLLQRNGFEILQYMPEQQTFVTFNPQFFYNLLGKDFDIIDKLHNTLKKFGLSDTICTTIEEYAINPPNVLFSDIYKDKGSFDRKCEQEATRQHFEVSSKI